MKLGRERFGELPVEVRDAIEAALPDEREKFKAAVAPLRRNREVDSAMSPGPELFEQELFAVDSEWPAAREFYEEYSSSTKYTDWLPDAKSAVANLFGYGARAASREQFASRDQREVWLKGKLLPAVLESMMFDRWAKEAIEGNRPQDIYVSREDLGKALPVARGPRGEVRGGDAQRYLRIKCSPHGELEVMLHYAGLSHQLGPETRDAVEDELRTHLLQLVSYWTQNFGRAVEPETPETTSPPPAEPEPGALAEPGPGRAATSRVRTKRTRKPSKPRKNVKTPNFPRSVTSLKAARHMEQFINSTGMTPPKFAEKANTTARTILRFRRLGRVRRDIFENIAKAMGTTPEELLKRD